MHLKRWISGLILGLGLIPFFLFSPSWLFLLFILFLTFIGLREFYALSLPGIPFAERTAGCLLGFLLPLSLYPRNPGFFLLALAFLLLFLFILALFQKDEFSARLEKVGRYLLGFLYVPFLLSHFILLEKLERGRIWVFFTLVAVYFGDTLAFYVGRAWGRKKLAPEISPGKTVEGGWGALGGSILGALLFKLLFFSQLASIHALTLGAGLGVIGQLGDLWESLMKRSAQVKDSGALIPGHGGLLDRIDSVLFAAPWVYYYAWGMGLG